MSEAAPWKRCAVCDLQIHWRSTLCGYCLKKWRSAVVNGEPWILALIDEARQDFNRRRQIFKTEKSLEEIEERKEIDDDVSDQD